MGLKITGADIPATSLTREFLPADYTDTYRCDTPEGVSFSPDDLQIAFWTDAPRWIGSLMKLRNLIVKPFGLKGGGNRSVEELRQAIRSGGTCGLFSVAAKNGNETAVMLQDRHLSAWMSVFLGGEGIYCITIVKYHKRLGRVYFTLIKPFHKLIVRSVLGSSVRKLSQNKE